MGGYTPCCAGSYLPRRMFLGTGGRGRRCQCPLCPSEPLDPQGTRRTSRSKAVRILMISWDKGVRRTKGTGE